MSEEVKKVSEAEFNKNMVRHFVSEGKGSSITPSKNAWVKLKQADLGKVGFGLLPDVPNKDSSDSKWVEPTGKTEGGSKGGSAGLKEKPESMWASKDLHPSIMVYVEPDPKRLRVKLNKKNVVLASLFITGMDSKYQSIMDELIDEIFVYLRSVGSLLRDCETKLTEKTQQSITDEEFVWEDDKNYFLDTAFQKWWSDSKAVNKLIKNLEDKRKED